MTRGYLVFNFNIPKAERRRLQKYGILNSEKRKSIEGMVELGRGKIRAVEILWNMYDAAVEFAPANEKVEQELSKILSSLPDIEAGSIHTKYCSNFESPKLAYRPKLLE